MLSCEQVRSGQVRQESGYTLHRGTSLPNGTAPYPIDSYRLVDVYELVDAYGLVFIA